MTDPEPLYRWLMLGLFIGAFANVVVMARFGFLVGNATAVLVCIGAAFFVRQRWKGKF